MKAAVELSKQIHNEPFCHSESLVDSQLMLAAGRHPLAASVERALLEHCQVSPGSSILIGCSGGPDSCALAVLVSALAARRDSVVSAPALLHVDHGIRPESSLESERVRVLAARIGASFHSVSLQLDSDQSDLAACARSARYAALENVAGGLGIHYVACAHHAEDRFETIIHGLCRGVGVEALANPRWCRALGSASLVRPLLDVSRNDLRKFCLSLEINFFDDPTNCDPSTMRGGLRDSVLPHLEDRWPGASVRASAAIDRIFVASNSLDREILAVLKHASSDRLELSLLPEGESGFISVVVRKWILKYAASHGHDLQDRLASSFFDEIARAVCDAERRPRAYNCAGLFTVHLDVRSLTIGVMPPGRS